MELKSLLEMGAREIKFSPDRCDLSIVMPTYNKGNIAEEAIKRVDSVARGAGVDYEIIVVDDGSMDNTRSTVINCVNGNSHIRVVSYRSNRGKGYAIKAGIQSAAGRNVIFVDGDLDLYPKQIIRYFDALNMGDIVIASKWHPQSRVKIPLVRRLLSRGFNLLVRLLTGLRFRDTQTGLKAARKEALEKIVSKLSVKRFAFDVEFLVIANLCGLEVAELPVNVCVGSSFNIREIWRMFLDLLGIAYRLRITKWYQRPPS